MATNSPHIRVAARAIIIRDDNLLVQYYREGDEIWCTMPGGGIDKGERLDQGLVRELDEEISVRVTVGPLRYVRELRGATKIKLLGGLTPDFHQIEHFFEVTEVVGEPMVGQKIDNCATHIGWIPLAELPQHQFFPGPLRDRLPQDHARGWPEGAVYIGDA